MSDKNKIRVYRAQDCVVFRKTNERFGGLSNMAPGFPLVINGVRIRTSEALYQACRFPHKPDVQQLIINQTSPMTAKMKSKPFRNETRSDWNRVRIKIMRWCLRVKLAQNWTKFGDLLLATSNLTIVEESRKDNFWGAIPQGDGTFVGHNILGRLLTELRAALGSSDINQFKSILPIEIPDFLLFGQAISKIEINESLENWFAKQETTNIQDAEGNTANTIFQVPESVSFSDCVKDDDIPYDTDQNNENTFGTGVIPKECKRLAEVDFPIAVVSKHSAREKSIRHGHPSTLHLWWARRPLAACRAMLLALLWPDPCDPHCPQDFKNKARELLAPMPGKLGKTDEDLRKALLRFIGDFADWDRSSDITYLEVSRALVKAAHGEEPPLVVDPFAGGGSIPLEALRVGCDTFASDLNPVACLILKVMLEDIPRLGREKIKIKKKNGEEIEANGLAEALRIAGKDIKETAEKELKEFYPDDADGAKPIAYLWARTVKCESPNCGAEIPLVRSFWLCKKPNRKRALRYQVIRGKGKGKGESPEIELEVFEPKAEKEVPNGTVTRAKATCLCCNAVLQPERVRAQLTKQKGGADTVFDGEGKNIGGARLLAVVTLKAGEPGRHYRLAKQIDYITIRKAQKRIEEISTQSLQNGLSAVVDESTPIGGGSGAGRAFSVQKYGMMTFGDLFTARQKLALVVFTKCINEMDISATLKELLALTLSHTTERSSSLCRWSPEPYMETVLGVFGRQALPIIWDFAEAAILTESTGSFMHGLVVKAQAVQNALFTTQYAQVEQADARRSPLPDDSCAVWFTDPPYYDAIPYSDLSDFFFVWLKRCLVGQPFLCDPFDSANPLSPKTQEAVQDETRIWDGNPKDRSFFERAMTQTFSEGRRVMVEDGIAGVVFAHKTTEGWEALLSGLIGSGWVITGSWPIATERRVRVRAMDSAALATSVHLVCRPRLENASVGDWSEVLNELPKRVGDWMERLQKEHIRGADLVFACIGPALEIFSRYSRVETAEGAEITLAQYLEKVWEVVGRSALEQILGTSEAQAKNGMAGALEEDARLTALFLWTLQSTNGDNGNNHVNGSANDEDEEEDDEAPIKVKTKGFSLIFDVVRRFAQPLGIHLPEWEGRIIETKKGVVRLLAISERAEQLFGKEGAHIAADRIEHSPFDKVQMTLFPELEEERMVRVRGRRRSDAKQGMLIVNDEALNTRREATTLDRVHAAMLLQTSGKANALRTLLKSEQDKGSDFLRLANALSALYPKNSEEKRLIDAMLLAMPR